MVDGEQLDLIEIRRLAQLFGDADVEAAVSRDQCAGGDLDVLVVIDREKLAVAGAGAERRYAKDVSDEAVTLAVPGPDHGAGAGEPLGFLVGDYLASGLIGFVLNEPVGPSGAHGIHDGARADVEDQRHAVTDPLLVERAGF